MRLLVGCLLFVVVALGFPQDKYEVAGLYQYTAPTGYKREDSRNPQGRVSFFAPVKSGYSANVRITLANAGGSTPSKIGKDGAAHMKQTDKEVSEIVGKEVKLGGKPAYSLVSVRNLSGVTVKQHQVVGVHKGKAVLITFSALKTTFDSDNAKFVNSLKSWVWAK